MRGLRNSWAPISGFERPSRASRAICSSCGVSSSRVSALRLRTFSPVASSSRRARSANASMPIAANISWAVRSCSRASDAPALAAQPLAVEQVRAGELRAQPRAAEPLDRLAVQRARRPRPRSAARATAPRCPSAQSVPPAPRRLGQPLERVARRDRVRRSGRPPRSARAAPSRRRTAPGRRRSPARAAAERLARSGRGRWRGPRRPVRVLRPPMPLAARRRLLDRRLDQRGGLGLAAPEARRAAGRRRARAGVPVASVTASASAISARGRGEVAGDDDATMPAR